MEELIITKEMREKINKYLGYELIRQNEVGHHIYDEAPGLGKIGIEGVELKDVVTNKQLDSNGNVEWFKNPNPSMKVGIIKPFHCKLTTVSSKKAKVLIASLFPEEAVDKNFLKENEETITDLKRQLNIVMNRIKNNKKTNHNKSMMGLSSAFLEGALLLYSEEEKEAEIPMASMRG